MPPTPPSSPSLSLHEFHRAFETVYQELVEAFPRRYQELSPLDTVMEDLGAFLARPGKRLRPLILLSGYALASGQASVPPPAILKAAAALELFHNFVLAHDDIIDAAQIRRGGPSLHKAVESRLNCDARAAEHQAMILGDIVFCFAVDCLNSPGIPEERRVAAMALFLEIAQDTGAGEAQELILTSTPVREVTERAIRDVYHLKTTRYTFEGPLQMGCLLGGATREESDRLARLVRPLGMAFQIENDCHEVEAADPENPDVGTDLAMGVKTLLLKRAYEAARPEDRDRMESWLSEARSSKPARLRLVEFLSGSPAFTQLKEEAARLFQEAEDQLNEADLEASLKSGLNALFGFLNKRRYHTQSAHLKG